MKTICKYTIKIGEDSVQMPKGARVLHVGGQDGHICLWALVDTERLGELRHFRVYRTGVEFPEDFVEDAPHLMQCGDRYTGTALSGGFVWHVFERPT